MVLFFLYIAVEAGYGNWVFTYVTRLGIANDTVASISIPPIGAR